MTCSPKQTIMPNWFAFALIAGVAFLPVASAATANDSSPHAGALETQLIAQVQARLDAIPVGNKTPWERDLDPRALLMDEEGNISSKQAFLAALTPLPKGSSGTLRVTHPRFEQDGDVAVLAFIADEHEMIYQAHFQARFGMVDTYHKVGDQWLLVSDQQTRLPLDPPTVSIDGEHMRRYAGRYRMVGGPLIFTVEIAKGVLVGGREGSSLLPMLAIADQPGAFFREGRAGTLIFVPGEKDGVAIKLIDRRYYNRDLTYERV
jgi:Domain of unknown function (DUF4440)